MNFYRIIASFYLIVFTATAAFASIQDIENRLIYSDYSKKISMDFRDVALSDALKVFSKQSGMNFISSVDVSTIKVTLFLDNVPVEEALEKILDANDLTYELTQDSNLFVVKQKQKNRTITKVFPLKFATVSTSKLNGASSGSASGIKTSIDSIKTKDGNVQEDPRTNSFIITDIPEQFPLYEETIAKLDVPVLQILIEVEILDVSKGSSDKIGVLYGSRPVSFSGGSRETLYPFDQNYILRKMNSGGAPYSLNAGDSTSSSSSSDSTESTGPANSLKFTPGTLDFSGMTAALDFLRSKSDTRTLARPRVMTLNNQTAHIEVGGDTTVGVDQINTPSSSGVAQISSTPITKQTGVILDVTPQANIETREIVLKITPEVNDVVQREFNINGVPVFDLQKRKADSILKTRSGETIVLGGLLRTDISNTVTKLPFLGDLPFFGSPFRHKNKSLTERELIIFITPHILDDNLKKKLDLEKLQRFDREGTNSSKMDAVKDQLDSSQKSLR